MDPDDILVVYTCFHEIGFEDYKRARGFDPAVIHSVHYICHPGLRQAVTQFIAFETETNVELTEFLIQKSVIGSGSSRRNGSKAAWASSSDLDSESHMDEYGSAL